VYRQSQYMERVAELRAEMELLELTYTSDYPDIVRLRQQVEDLKSLALREKNRRQARANVDDKVVSPDGGYVSNSNSINPIYQQLSSDASKAQAFADSLKSRLDHTKVLLKNEISRSTKTTQVERELAELSRDYQVNQDIYQDLLRRRESARVSMTLDKERQGVLYRIQEPASFPILPTGARFIHFAMAGLVLGLILPIMYLVAFLQVDPRIRVGSTITDEMDLPLLAIVPHMKSQNERIVWYRQKGFLLGVMTFVILTYVLVMWLKMTQVA